MTVSATQKEQSKDNPSGIAALIITHRVRTGNEECYEAWLEDVFVASSAFPGYLDREIFRPSHGDTKYTSIVRFDSLESLNGWAESDTRKEYICRVGPLLEESDQVTIRSGIDFWFTPKGVIPPKPTKQFLLTVSAVYPLSLIIPLFLGLLVKLVPELGNFFVSSLLMAVILTGMLTFIVMPPYTRLLKRWLYEQED